MRILFILLGLTYASFSGAAVILGGTDTLSGNLIKDAKNIYFEQSQTGAIYRISSMSSDAREGFKQLDTGDYVTGFGALYPNAREAHFESVDYVGLKKLLGSWYSGNSVVRFATFTNLSIYPLFPEILEDLLSVFSVLPPSKVDFRYSTAPFEGSSWAFFLSDSSATSLGTLEFNTEFAVLRLYDTQTGGSLRTLHLVRWSE